MSRSAQIAALAVLLGVATLQAAPTQTVVQWSARVEPATVVKAGADFEAVIDARIDPGWHLYALTQEGGGPQALVITVPPGSPFKIAGSIIAPLPITAPDANFNIDTQ